MEDLTAQLDRALGQTGQLSPELEDTDIDLGDASELDHVPRGTIGPPSPALVASAHSAEQLDRTSSLSSSSPHQDDMGSRHEEGDGSHHSFTYGQLMPTPPSPYPSSLNAVCSPVSSMAAAPYELDPLSQTHGDDDNNDASECSRPGLSNGGVGGAGGPCSWALSGAAGSSSNDGVGGVIGEGSFAPLMHSEASGSGTRLQYSLPPNMTQSLPCSAGGPSSPSRSSPAPVGLPRMSQRSVPLYVTVTEPLKKEQAGMFGIKAGYVTYLVTSKAQATPPGMQAAELPVQMSKPCGVSVRRRFRDFVALSDVLKVRWGSHFGIRG